MVWGPMRKTAVKSSLSLLLFLVLTLLLIHASGCVSVRDTLRLETLANSPLMKNLQDNDEDLFQIEDGTGAVGEAAACPT